jgi:hypothetical protein
MHYALAAGAALSLCACTVATTSPAAPSAIVRAPADALSIDGFQPDFYRAFVQNALESPDHLEASTCVPPMMPVARSTRRRSILRSTR